MIGVAWAGSPDTYRDFVSRHRLSFPNIDDTGGDMYSLYGVASQPAWVFLRNGAHRTVRGTLTPDAVREAVAGLRNG